MTEPTTPAPQATPATAAPTAPSALRTVLRIARTDLLRRLRNKSAIITAIVAPFLIATVFAVLSGGNSTFTLAVADADHSALSSSIATGLVSPSKKADTNGLEFVKASPASARQKVEDGTYSAAIVLPAGFGAAVTGGTHSGVEVITNPDSPISGQIASSVAEEIASRSNLPAQIAAAGASTAGVNPATIPAALSIAPPKSVSDDPSAGAYFGAGMSIMFMFFSIGYATRSLLTEQREGTLDRLLASPIRASTVLAGKTLSVGLLSLIGFVIIWGLTTVLMGASWGNPIGVTVTIVATVIAVSGVALAAASLASTEQNVENISSAVALVLAIVGGNFIASSASNPVSQLRLFTPNGWALRTFSDLTAGIATPGSVVVSTLILLGFGAVFGGIGLRRIYRLVAP